MYLAIKWQETSASTLQTLTPHLMSWDEDTWLMDLSACMPYWQLLARQRSVDVSELLREAVQERVGDTEYLAVLAEHPWQAVLLLTYLRERQLTGFVDRSQSFGSGLYRDISWQSWWHVALKCGEFAEQNRTKRFKLDQLKRHLKQLQAAVENLGTTCPWEMQTVGAQAMRRRYGSFVTQLWDWTFPEANHRIPHTGFPWVSYKFPEDIVVKRWLDEPVYQWDQLRLGLLDDLDRLCALESFSERQKLVCLEWRLTLHDASTLSIPIRFRHPHSLHSEAKAHGTALLQANYAFEDVMQAKQKECLEETDSYAPPIVGWGSGGQRTTYSFSSDERFIW